MERLALCEAGLPEHKDEDSETKVIALFTAVVATDLADRGPEIEDLDLEMKWRVLNELDPGAGQGGFRLRHGLIPTLID